MKSLRSALYAAAQSCVLVLLYAYKRVISPLLPTACRFYPTCSEYAIEAVEYYGVWRGGWMAVKRIGKCHPFHPGGIDLVTKPSEYSSCGCSHRDSHEHSAQHTQTAPSSSLQQNQPQQNQPSIVNEIL